MSAVCTRRALLKAAGAAALSRPVGALAAVRRSRTEFAPAIGVCAALRDTALLAQHGVDYVEESVGRLLQPQKPDDEVEAALADAKSAALPVRAANSFLPGALPCVGPRADHAGILIHAKNAFERARRVGIEVIVFGSSASRSRPEGVEEMDAERQFVDLLRKLGPLAERFGILVAVEPLQRSETNFINTLEHGARLVRAAAHAHVALTADIFHMLRMDEPPAHIVQTGALVRHVHVAEKAERTPPGIAGDDFRPYLKALREIGYAGRISIECRWRDLAEQLPPAVGTLRRQIEESRGS